MNSSKDEVKVLRGWFSPYAIRVELALRLKGIPYESLDEDLANKSPLLHQLNPVYKKIPVLVHNGKPICESVIILEYIDEIWKHNPIMPELPYDKAMARFWAKFIDDKFTAAVRGLIIAANEEQKQKEVDNAKEALKILEQELHKKGSKFFGGDTVGLVDLTLSFFNSWLAALEKAVSVKVHSSQEFPLIDKWNKNFIELPFVKEFLPPQDKLDGFFASFKL